MRDAIKGGWKPQKLDELGFVGRGKSKHRPRNDPSLYGGRYPFIQTGEVKSAEFYITEYSQTYNEKGLAQSKLWEPGTLLITIAANIAETAILGIEACFPDSIVGFIANPLKADERFIKYYIDTIKLHMQSVSKGTTQDNLSLGKLLSFDFLIPPIATQRKIADILSAYDRLIENNTRRIKILEEMAQLLYHEWFVNFRFPGYENVSMVESELGLIPQDWRITDLGEVISVKHGYAFKSSYFSEEPTADIVLTPGNFAIGGGFQNKKLKYYKGKVPDDFILSAGDLLVTMTDLSKTGDTLGYPAFIPPSKTLRFLHNQRLGKVLTNDEHVIGKNFLYNVFCSDSYRHHVLATATGSTVRHTAPDRIKAFKFALPAQSIIRQFERVAELIRDQIECLRQKNQNLRQTRDLLLPKLISGEIDVEALDTSDLEAIAA